MLKNMYILLFVNHSLGAALPEYELLQSFYKKTICQHLNQSLSYHLIIQWNRETYYFLATRTYLRSIQARQHLFMKFCVPASIVVLHVLSYIFFVWFLETKYQLLLLYIFILTFLFNLVYRGLL